MPLSATLRPEQAARVQVAEMVADAVPAEFSVPSFEIGLMRSIRWGRVRVQIAMRLTICTIMALFMVAQVAE
jgi:hypothetical protein